MKKRFLTLTKWYQLGPEAGNQAGLWALFLDCWERNGNKFKHIGRLVVNSGQPNAQTFRTLDHQVAGHYEPLAEACYTPGPLEFASGRWEDYSGIFEEVASPIWFTIYGPRAIGGHLDGNREKSPGSAACVVFRNMYDLKTYVAWCQGDPYCMTSLWVDWGLGSITLPEGLVIPEPDMADVKPAKVEAQAPPAPPPAVYHYTKLFYNNGKCTALRDGLPARALAAQFDFRADKLGVSLNGSGIPPERVHSVQLIVTTK